MNNFLKGMPSIHIREDEIQVSINPRWGSMHLLEDGGSFLDGAIEVSCYDDGTVSSISIDLEKIDGMKLDIVPEHHIEVEKFHEEVEKSNRIRRQNKPH